MHVEKQLLEKLQIEQGSDAYGAFVEDLDELTYELASRLASTANNGGLRGQVEFICEQVGAKDALQTILDFLGKS